MDETFDAYRLDVINQSALWENIFVTVKGMHQNSDIIIGNIYQPLKNNYCVNNINNFTAEFENSVSELKDICAEVLIAGEFNINLLDMGTR